MASRSVGEVLQQQVATCSNKPSLDPQGAPPTPRLRNDIDRIYVYG